MQFFSIAAELSQRKSVIIQITMLQTPYLFIFAEMCEAVMTQRSMIAFFIKFSMKNVWEYLKSCCLLTNCPPTQVFFQFFVHHFSVAILQVIHHCGNLVISFVVPFLCLELSSLYYVFKYGIIHKPFNAFGKKSSYILKQCACAYQEVKSVSFSEIPCTY